MSKSKESKGKTLKAIKSLSDINPYCLEVTIEDLIRLVNTIEKIHELCKEVKGE